MKFADVDRVDVSPFQRDATGRDVLDYFKCCEDCVGAAVIGQDDRPIGYIDRIDFMTRISTLYGRALYDGRSADSLCSQKYRTFRLSEDIQILLDLDDSEDPLKSDTGLIVVEDDGRYAGVLSAMSLATALLSEHRKLINELQQEVAVRKAAEERARRLAELDSLTGLSNRRHFMSQLSELASVEKPFWLFYIDLDKFKAINDAHGHAVGDFVLKTVAVRLLQLGEGWNVARLGGDEFAIIADPARAAASPEAAMEVIAAALAEPIMTPSGVQEVGVSIGCARYPDDETEPGKVVDCADQAMLCSKQRGGGSCAYHTCEHLNLAGTSQLRDRVKSAVQSQKVFPVYQPIICLKTGDVIGHEVLARLPRTAERAVGPQEFIPQAETMGLIDPLFWSLIDQVFARVAETKDERFLAFNISPAQLRSSVLAERMKLATKFYKIPPELIELEITETAMVTDKAASRTAIDALRRLGTRIALDDFGTGYSSLSLLREFPISKLKIDRSFVSQAGSGDMEEKIVDAALGLCEGLNLVSCAEGVETQDVLEALQERGCQQAQGFLLGMPMADPVAIAGPVQSADGKADKLSRSA